MQNMKITAPFAAGNTASREAAEQIQHRLTGIRAQVFDYIAGRARQGATGQEIADGLGILSLTVKPRCTELRDAGYIRDSGEMRKNSNGRNETVWVAVIPCPVGPWKALAQPKPDRPSDGPSGLEVFDDVFYRNPHLRATFSISEIAVIRADLEKAAAK